MPESQREPRLVPELSFPPYSYVPGHFPHPVTDPQGHSYGVAATSAPDLSNSPWQSSRDYLLGFDLFNAGYYWEAHETWEALWHAAGRRGKTAALLQGLIKLAAAAVKTRQGNPIGRRRHATRARELFDIAWRDSTPVQSFLGLQHTALMEAATILEHCRGELREPDIHFQVPISLRPKE